MSTLTQMKQADDGILVGPNGEKFTNNSNVPKPLALFAIYHSAQYDGKPTTATNLSVSNFLTPMRKLIYTVQNPTTDQMMDVAQVMKSAKGTCMHTGLENALNWAGGYKQEIRSEKVIDGVTISGKFDLIDMETMTIQDLKNVGNYAYKRLMEDMAKLQTMDNTMSLADRLHHIPTYTKYQLQLSMYKWLNPDIPLKPWGDIIFSLNDGGGMERYPIDNFHRFPLLLDEEIEQFVNEFLIEFKQHLTNGTYPNCTDDERGFRPGSWKLQRVSPTTGKLSTVRGSIHSDEASFRAYAAKKAKPGDVELITEPKYALCEYCKFSGICDQE